MFEHIKQHRLSRHLVRGLAALLVLQLLLPIQAHSRMVLDARGLTVLVCTLEGLREVHIEPGESASAATPHTSAAMLFSDLLHNVSPLGAALQPPKLVLTWTTDIPTMPVPVHYCEQRTPKSRGPPVVA